MEEVTIAKEDLKDITYIKDNFVYQKTEDCTFNFITQDYKLLICEMYVGEKNRLKTDERYLMIYKQLVFKINMDTPFIKNSKNNLTEDEIKDIINKKWRDIVDFYFDLKYYEKDDVWHDDTNEWLSVLSSQRAESSLLKLEILQEIYGLDNEAGRNLQIFNGYIDNVL